MNLASNWSYPNARKLNVINSKILIMLKILILLTCHASSVLKEQEWDLLKKMYDIFVFQQHNAPSHRAEDTIKLLQQETPDFIGPDLWPPNSPNQNPVDYKVWVLCSRECMNVV